MNIEELQKRVDENTDKILMNLDKINQNEINIQKNSMALDILRDYKRKSNWLFTMWIITFIAFISLLGYTIWLLNDIQTEETTVTQENDQGYNNYIGNDGDIYNGEANDKN